MKWVEKGGMQWKYANDKSAKLVGYSPQTNRGRWVVFLLQLRRKPLDN